MRGIGHRGGNDRGYGQSNRSAELRTGVEHGATQSLHALWENVGDDEQADGEKDVAAQRCEDLCGTELVRCDRIVDRRL